MASMALATLLSFANAQAGPNTLAVYNPANRTMSSNESWFIVPVATSSLQPLVPWPLLTPPDDTTLFPLGFPAGYHPVIIAAGYINDIRMNPENLVPLEIPSLMQADIIVPYTDRLQDGQTPFGYSLNYYIGGTNGDDLESLVPSLASDVSPFEGTTIYPAEFAPSTAASQSLGGGIFSIEVNPFVVPNDISGPGVTFNAFAILYENDPTPIYTPHTFHSILNQPQILNEGQCQRNTFYFNASFANPTFSSANITVISTALLGVTLPNSPPSALQGVYTNVVGYTANGELVASLPEDCALSPSYVPAAATE